MIRYYQAEGFRVGTAKCCDCHFQWVAVVRPETVAWRLECPTCHNPRERHVMESKNWFQEFAVVAR